MNLEVISKPLEQLEGQCLVVLATKDGAVLNGPENATALLKPFVESGEFGTNPGGTVYLVDPAGLAVERLFFYNLGEKVKTPQDLRKATAKSWRILREKGRKNVAVSLDGLDNAADRRAVVEGFILGDYQFSQFKTEKDKLPAPLETLRVHSSQDCKAQVERWFNICHGTLRARDLCQMPANVLHPSKLAELAAEWGSRFGYKTTVLEENDCRKEGMGSFLSVSQGSDQPGKFIIMEYEPKDPSGKTVVLVGKAVTFDSGGLNIKTSLMEEMKGDMGGGAAVVGIMTVLKQADCRHRVVGLVPAVENMPSGKATRPSDVITTLSGLTVEVNNTDAEGRLIMIDALTYGGRYKPDYVIDYATLTGACVAALGPKVFGVMGNHQPLVDAIVRAGEAVHEPFWQLPLVDEYNEYLKSQTADISNLPSTRYGGAITAGLFLQRFARDYQWAHCDIASSIFEKSDELNPVGGTGVGVRMTVEAFDNL